MEYQPRPYEAYEEQPIPHQQQHQQQQPPMQQHSLLSNGDFLKRVEIIKADILTLTSNVSKIASLHQSVLGDPYSSKTADLNALITQTQVLNTSIKDQIKFLETDAARSHGNAVKDTQVKQLKNSFQRQLQDYRAEEANYERQYREQIKRQYEIVNPHASEAEKEEAAEANWGDEGVFQTALRSNRSATATTVLGAVRARHNDIQKIETTIIELNRLMEELATTIILQEEPVQAIEQRTDNVRTDMEQGNTQLTQGIKSARRARKLKWWCLGITVLICIIIALVIGLYFGLQNSGHK
ncbi:t-SNARE [Neohortaea acidophila]|uniref:t-SNARE n=1 Tax=Neohortaea acidophila TaxID=245834 RepID=A0A6A6PWF2_9PEZI|nr:t-SNARE [Neohortaea acidophila]KAF2484096.1 t-SNARE [Neohortaea acidophila]